MSDSRILIVDDEPLVRSILANELVDLAHDVMEAGTAEEAIVALAAARFDLVITDLRMPGRLDGASLARIVAAGYPGVPVIMISGAEPDPDDVAAVDAFFAKPLDLARLCQRVEVLLAAARNRQATEDPPPSRPSR